MGFSVADSATYVSSAPQVGGMSWFPNEFQVALIHHRPAAEGQAMEMAEICSCRMFWKWHAVPVAQAMRQFRN